jgi:hypothetical protein
MTKSDLDEGEKWRREHTLRSGGTRGPLVHLDALLTLVILREQVLLLGGMVAVDNVLAPDSRSGERVHELLHYRQRVL